MKNLFICIFLFSLYSCNEPLIPDPVGTPEAWQPEIIWQRPHGPGGRTYESVRPIIYENSLISFYSTSYGQGYWVYNMQTGVAVKEINDKYVINTYRRPYVFEKYHISIESRIRVMDLDNLEVTVSPPLKDVGIDQLFLVHDDGYLYLGSGGFQFPSKIIIKRIRLENLAGPIETVLEDNWPDDIKNSRNTMAFGGAIQKNEKGEKILYYGNLQAYTDTLKFTSRTTYNAYNLDNKKHEWQYKLESNGNAIGIPYFYKNSLILISTNDITALDTKSGNLLWKKNFKQITWEDQAVVDNLLFISEHDGKLWKINIETGDVISSLQLLGSGNSGWAVHNNRLYLVSNFRLLGIDLTKMSIEWTWNRNIAEFGWPSFGGNAPVIDKKTNRLFVADSRDMFCIKIPD